MRPLTLWETIVGWFCAPYAATQCKAINAGGFYCQRRYWHKGEHRYWNEL